MSETYDIALRYAEAVGILRCAAEGALWSIKHWVEHGALDYPERADDVLAMLDKDMTAAALAIDPAAVRCECARCGMIKCYGKRPATHGICAACAADEHEQQD